MKGDEKNQIWDSEEKGKKVLLRKEISPYYFLLLDHSPQESEKKGKENASPAASVHAFSKTTVITWLDADNRGDDFSVGIGGPTPEPASWASTVELVKEEAVWILSEWQQVQGAIVQLTAVTNSIRNQLSEKCTYGRVSLQKQTTLCSVFDRTHCRQFSHLATEGWIDKTLPLASTQSIIGGGSPLAKQSKIKPVLLEYKTSAGGVCKKAGPYAAAQGSQTAAAAHRTMSTIFPAKQKEKL